MYEVQISRATLIAEGNNVRRYETRNDGIDQWEGIKNIDFCRSKTIPFMEDSMLQRYDISIDGETNRLSIKEFAVVDRKLQKREYYDHTKENYSLIHEVTYDGSVIRSAINKGQEALISELRSDDFFPVHPWAKIMAEEVTSLFNGSLDHISELFFDDRILLSETNEKH